ncbi:unnamed protein product [Effrenium voratum]|nr:unnamed protein product [Effrenium voratum]
MTRSSGFNLHQLNEAPEAVREHMARVNPTGSQFDLCTWATGMGFVDICGCSMVMLPRRTDASPFLTLWTEPVVLVGPLRGNQGLGGDFGAMLGKAFRPLSPGLWGLAVVVALSMSFLITMFEKTEGGQFEDVEHGESFGSGLFMAFFSLVTFEVQFAPQTVGGRIVSLGLAFILILLVSGYTASLTSFLVVDNRLSSTVSDLNGAIRLGLKICAHRSDSVQLLLNGVKEENVVIQQSRSVVLPSVSEGACDLAVVRQEDLEASQAQNGGSFCQLTRIGDPVTTSWTGNLRRETRFSQQMVSGWIGHDRHRRLQEVVLGVAIRHDLCRARGARATGAERVQAAGLLLRCGGRGGGHGGATLTAGRRYGWTLRPHQRHCGLWGLGSFDQGSDRQAAQGQKEPARKESA